MLEKVPQALRDAVFDDEYQCLDGLLSATFAVLRRPHFVFAGRRRHGAVFFAKQCDSDTRGNGEIFYGVLSILFTITPPEIRGGFVSADRALRVGIGGTAVIEKGGIKTVRDGDRESLSCVISRRRYGDV